MTALIVIGCILLAVLLLMLLRVGCRVDYSADGLILDLKIAVFHIRLMPRQKKSKEKKEKRKQRRKRKQKKKQKSNQKQPKEKTRRRPGDLAWLLELIRPIWTALGRLRRKLCINYLCIDYTIGGMGDPAGAAIRCGQISAGGGALLPLINEAFEIREFDMTLDVDFLEEKTRVAIQAEASYHLGQLLRILLSLGVTVLRAFINHRNHSENKEDHHHGRKKSAQ